LIIQYFDHSKKQVSLSSQQGSDYLLT